MEQYTSIAIYPEVQDGAPVFRGTRIRIETFYDFIRLGISVDDFLSEFPSVTPDQAYEVFTLANSDISLDEIRNLASGPDSRFHTSGIFERGLQSAGRR